MTASNYKTLQSQEQEILSRAPRALLETIITTGLTGRIHSITQYSRTVPAAGYAVQTIAADSGAIVIATEMDGRMLDETTVRKLVGGEYASGCHLCSFDRPQTRQIFRKQLHRIGRSLKQEVAGTQVVYRVVPR